MCLYIDEKRTKRVQRTFKERAGTTVMWKVLKLSSHYDIYKGKFINKLMSPYEKNIYEAGWKVSNRCYKRLGYYDLRDNVVRRGIHVYTNKTKALQMSNSIYGPTVVIPVTVCVEDFLYAGTKYDAVFMKVYVDERYFNEALEKALKEKRKRKNMIGK